MSLNPAYNSLDANKLHLLCVSLWRKFPPSSCGM